MIPQDEMNNISTIESDNNISLFDQSLTPYPAENMIQFPSV